MKLLSAAQEFSHNQSTYTNRPHNIRITREDGCPRVISTVYQVDGWEDLINTASEGTQLYKQFQSVITNIRNSIQVTENETVSHLHISDVPPKREQDPTKEPYSLEEADARVKLMIEKDLHSTGIPSTIERSFIQFLSAIDPDLKPNHIANASFSFTDESDYTVSRVSLRLETPFPHRYYENVSSLDEFVEKLAYTPDSVKSMIRTEGHNLKLESEDTYLWDSLHTIKRTVNRYIRSTLTSIQNRFLIDSYRTTYGELNMNDFRYNLYIPVTDNTLGKTK